MSKFTDELEAGIVKTPEELFTDKILAGIEKPLADLSRHVEDRLHMLARSTGQRMRANVKAMRERLNQTN